MSVNLFKRTWLNRKRVTSAGRERRRRQLARKSGFESLEGRAMMARDFTEAFNDTAPGQLVEHFPGLGYVVDSYSSGASITDGDLDYYQVTSAVAGELTVVLRNQGGNPSGDDTSTSGDDLVLEQVDSTGTTVLAGPLGVNISGASRTITVPGIAGTTSYFRVRGADGNDDANYQIEFASRDWVDSAGGSNSTLATATPLGALGSFAPGILDDYTITSPDKDYFSFQVPANTPGELAVSVVMPTGSGAASGTSGPTNLGVRIRNSAGVVLSSSNGTVTAVDTATFVVPNSASATTYFIEVYSGSLGQVNDYDLEIVANPVVTGDLSGFKFNDLNTNGLWDEDEPGIDGVRISLDLNDDASEDLWTWTSGGGAYTFSGVPLGLHRVYETVPANSYQSLPVGGGYTIEINEENQILDHLDFGNYQLDFGDLEDPTFPTLLASDGARHTINSGLYLGASVDAELDGQPSGDATGDNVTDLDDEDGVAFTNLWIQGGTANIDVTSSGSGYLNAWVDFNDDGDWSDLGEQVFSDVEVGAGSNLLSFSIPVAAAIDTAAFRLRLSTQDGISYDGLAIGGEVEDYERQIYAPATIEFVTTSGNVAEGNSKTIDLRLNLPAGSLAYDTSVNIFDLFTGSASDGSDYFSLGSPEVVIFPAGSVDGAIYSFDVETIDDLLAEFDETVDLEIDSIDGSGGQVTIGANSAYELTITDDSDRSAVSVRFLSSSSSVAEADTDFDVDVELVTTGGISLGVDLTVEVTDAGGGSATSGLDYVAVGTQVVTFSAGAGNGDVQPATLEVLDDTIAELDETVNLALANASPFGSIVPPDTHEVTITDDDDRSHVTVQFESTTSSVAEANTGHDVGVELVLTGGITSIGYDLTADVTDATGGTATSGADYSPVGTETVTFVAGSTDGAIEYATIDILDDTLAEVDETINLSLGSVSGPGGLGSPDAHTVTITDDSDRSEVTVRFVSASSTLTENNTTHDVDVELVTTGGITLAYDVVVEVTDTGTGTASTPADYDPIGTVPLTFAAGSGNGDTQSVTITIVEDAIYETPDETIVLDLAFVSGPAAGLAAPTTHTVTIEDDDQPSVSITADTDGNEARPVDGVFTISISSQSSTATTVNFTVGGTATSGSDYTSIGTSIIIPANTSFVTLTVPVLNDRRVEGTETVLVTLTSASAGVVVNAAADDATIDILDNDSATVAFSSATYSVGESAGPGTLTVDLVITANGLGTVDIEYPISVDVRDLGTGTATGGGTDYTFSPNPQTVTFTAGSGPGSQNVSVPITAEAVIEADETVDFELQNLSGPATLIAPDSATLTILNDDFPAISGRKFNDLDGDTTDDGGTDPGLAGWTIRLYSDVNNNNVFEPNIYLGDLLVIAGADGDPLETTVTSGPNGQYVLGSAGMPNGRYFVAETQQQGWRQTLPASFYTINYLGTPFTDRNFGNTNCTDRPNVVDGVQPTVTAANKGIVTIELIGGGTFTVTKSGGGSFTSYDGAGGTVSATIASSRSSEYSPREDGRQRVDLLANATEQFIVSVTGSSGSSVLRIVNGVNVDTASTLALQVTGTACGETIVIRDDANFGATSDAKRIYIGATSGEFDAGVDLGFDGVEYSAAIINAMFGNPTISRVDVSAGSGDDIVRIGAEITQQSTMNGADGSDILRAGGGKSTITAGNGNDFVVGGPADDTIYGGAGNDYIAALGGSDRVFGDDGDDWIAGGDGDDALLRGGNGNDSISGGNGADRLLGEAGAANVAYRDAADVQVTGFTAANTHFTPPDPVQDFLDQMIDEVWNDSHLAGTGNEDASLDTLDELFASLLP